MIASERTLADLHFQTIRDALAERCRTEPGRARARARPFLDSASKVHDELTLVAEARALLAEPLQLPLAGVTDVQPLLERAAKGALLEPRELLGVTATLFAFERTLITLEERRDRLPHLATFIQDLPELDKLATRLDRSFEPSGELHDRASPELREARERARGLHRAIKARLDKMLADERFAASLREAYYSMRNDRYVVPVDAQHQAQIPGIVHNASQSGQTLFVEPQELIPLGNDLAIAQSMVLEEERRILLELSGQVGRHSEEIARGLSACARLDEAEGAARLANQLAATNPRFDTQGDIVLKSLRHPLLVLRAEPVVANTVELAGPLHALVISGPNAGGKTVTLTAVGLAALMLRAGLPVPVDEGSCLPLFTSVHSTVGDAQDLARGLSTFSAHVTELREILLAAGESALVLIDEIAADTDPREGAALAIAVLEELIGRGARILVTTHLEELKSLAHLDQRFANARVGFDSRRMAPTYLLHIGASGSSSAIDIAARVGLPEHLCARARELAVNSGGALSKALAAVEQERRRTDEELAQARRATLAAQQIQREAEEARTRLVAAEAQAREKSRAEETRFRDGLRAELLHAQEQIKELVTKLEQQASLALAREAQEELAARTLEQERGLRRLREERSSEPAPTGPADLRVGGWVRHAGLDRDVEIIELHGNEATVAAGALRMRVPLSSLTAPRTRRPEARFPSQERGKRQLDRAQSAMAAAPIHSGSTCDVRGQRAEDAVRDVERFLDRVVREGQETALIIHGHGTGALKAAIREYLARSPYVDSHRPGDSAEGGDGTTQVMLKP